MRLMGEHYHYHPYKGAPRMYVWLNKDQGFQVSRNRIDRLYYQVMGLRAIVPGPHTSKRHKDHAVFPYLLRGLAITRPQQVWATDITYMPLPRGFMYLTAVIDLYSRYVLNWSLSNTMEAEWCRQLIADAIAEYGSPGHPEHGSRAAIYQRVVQSICRRSGGKVEHGREGPCD